MAHAVRCHKGPSVGFAGTFNSGQALGRPSRIGGSIGSLSSFMPLKSGVTEEDDATASIRRVAHYNLSENIQISVKMTVYACVCAVVILVMGIS